MPTRLPQDGFAHSIREEGSNVKVKLNDVTKSLQFKDWFSQGENLHGINSQSDFFRESNDTLRTDTKELLDTVEDLREVKTVARDVLAGKKANEVDYGRQDGFVPEEIIAHF